jgi:predicted ATPase/class 3 adenylate cyclase
VAELPTGTVTFLITDLVGSTLLWEEQPDATVSAAMARHDVIVREAIERHHGTLFATMGDGVAAVFVSAGDGLGAAFDIQHELGTDQGLQARIALYSDEGRLRAPGEYVNRPINRCARLMAIAHGGQVLVSGATAAVGRDVLPVGAGLRDLGQHRLRDLAEPMHVFQLTHPDLPGEFPLLRSLDALPGNLPRQVTSFVGCDDELERVVGLVRVRPLVTLTGVGGVGKTRLALQVAAEVIAEFADGAWLCELAPVTDPEAVWATVAMTIGVAPIPGRPMEEVVLEYMAPKRLLLVLDNCEHLLGAAARTVSAIGQHCVQVSVLATSREGLAVAGEQMVALRSLDLPARAADADQLGAVESVRLFCDRAHDVESDFVLDAHNADAVAELCRRLDGIPLAIELAAARVRSLAPADLVARLDQRFSLLTRGSRAALERHQTLRHTIDWSYDLLSDAERAALRRLSVFAGGCDLDAAEAILGDGNREMVDATDLLTQLVDKSLVVVDQHSRPVRYRLLETIRQYAQERLELSAETSAVRDRHLEHYVGRVEAAAPHLRRRGQLEWAATLTSDLDNMRAAFDYAIDAVRPGPALRLVAALAVPGLPIGWTVMHWAETASTIPGAQDDPLFARVVAIAAIDATQQGDLERGAALVRLAEETQASLGINDTWVYAAASASALYRGEFDEAERYAAIRVEHARASGDSYEIAHGLLLLASTRLRDPPRGAAVAEEAVRVARDAGLFSTLPYALAVYNSFVGPEDPAREREIFDEMLDAGKALGDPQLVASTLAARDANAGRRGDWPVVLRSGALAAEQYREGGNPMLAVVHFQTAAIAFTALGRFEPAAICLGFADAHATRFGSTEFVDYLDRSDTALRKELGEQHFEELKAHGGGLDISAAIKYLANEAESALEHHPSAPRYR